MGKILPMKAVILNIGDPSHYSPSNNNAIMNVMNLVVKAVNVVPDIEDPGPQLQLL